jgi:hypothetical protein
MERTDFFLRSMPKFKYKATAFQSEQAGKGQIEIFLEVHENSDSL